MARHEAGGLEREVLRLIGAASQSLSVAEVRAALAGPPAYTTVMTTLNRLTLKGALRRVLHGRAYRYMLAVPSHSVADALVARRMRRLLSEGGDKAGVLARFVAELDPEEEEMLQSLLHRDDDEQNHA